MRAHFLDLSSAGSDSVVVGWGSDFRFNISPGKLL